MFRKVKKTREIRIEGRESCTQQAELGNPMPREPKSLGQGRNPDDHRDDENQCDDQDIAERNASVG